MQTIKDVSKKRPWINWLLFLATMIVVFLIGLFASSVIERRGEQKLYFQMTNEIPEWEPRNEVWGQNFPREFETYTATKDTAFKSKYGGSVWGDYLAENPDLVILWAGYAFSKEYNHPRGHYYAIQDIRNILRTVQPQPATCWSCKSTDVPRVMNKVGVAEFYHATWMDMGKEINNPIGCQDCHDPKTMNLRITRPALIEAFQRQGKDINKATHQEMRSLVCAQCHVEYYFKGDGKYLTFPWDKGMSADSMEAYYDKEAFIDWTNTLGKIPMLKAQHPDYELFSMGIHANRGVACADCHMPYKRDGGMKFTDHKIQSPLNNISGSCQVCHRESEEKLRQNVYDIQDKVFQVRRLAEQNLVAAHIGSKIALENGATAEEMKVVQQLIRHAQWRWDYVAASNGMGFHAPAEALRILATSIQKAQEARILLVEILMKHNVKLPFAMPDISTKDKAQAFVGLDMKKIREEKDNFRKSVLPEWQKKDPKGY